MSQRTYESIPQVRLRLHKGPYKMSNVSNSPTNAMALQAFNAKVAEVVARKRQLEKAGEKKRELLPSSLVALVLFRIICAACV